MITELLENIDRLEGLGVLSTQQRLDLGRRDEQPVERELQFGRSAEYDLFVLDWDWKQENSAHAHQHRCDRIADTYGTWTEDRWSGG